ncbi:MAG: hypothetical protein IJM75_00085 [Ruminococcus sp.]|nr:hypothetical protein [Ruminococcus sp.]
MKKIFTILRNAASTLCAAAIIGSCGISAAANDKEYDLVSSPVPEKILVMGDSIATGYGLDGYDKGRENVQSYSNMLKDEFSSELKVGKEELINKAIDGQTSWELLEDIKKGEYDSYLKSSDLILISIGGNDLLHTLYGYFSENTDYGVSLKDLMTDHSVGDLVEIYSGLSKVLEQKIEEYGDNLKEMSAYIKGVTDARVILQTLYNPLDTTEKPKLFMAFVKSKINGLNEKILENEKDENGASNYSVADVFEAFAGQGDTLTNIKKIDIHPNADGHKKIYETLDPIIRETSYTIEVEKPKAEPAQSAPKAEKDELSDGTKTALLIGGGAVLIAIVVGVMTYAKRKGN